MKVVFIKIGGSLLAPKDKLYALNKGVLEILSKQIKELVLNFPEYRFILGNGAGSFGHAPAVDYGLKGKLYEDEKIFGACFVHRKVIKLNTIFVEELQNKKVKAFQFIPGSFLLAKKGEVEKVFFEGILSCLKNSCVPVVFGDVVPDEDYGFSIISTEKVFKAVFNACIKHRFNVERIIFLGDYEGVYDDNGKIIKEIKYSEYEKMAKFVKEVRGKDITGGMKHKLEEAFYFCQKGVTVHILGFSEKENRLLELMYGKSIGTVLTL